MNTSVFRRFAAGLCGWMLVVVPVAGHAQPPATLERDSFDPYLLPSEPPPDFDLAAMERRHRMLRWHEALSIVTILTVGAQVTVGQIVMAREGERPVAVSTRRLQDAALGLSLAAGGTYLTAASLAVAAPPIPRGSRYDAFSWHKGLTLLHGVGAVLVPVLGLAIREERAAAAPNPDRLHNLQTAQQAAGYSTLGTLIGAAVVIAID